MSIAKQALDQLSLDPQARRLARERENSLRLYQMHLAASRIEGAAEGHAAGEAKGRAALLLRQLDLRFGPLSPEARERVAAASTERLDQWAERVLTAETLEEVLVS